MYRQTDGFRLAPWELDANTRAWFEANGNYYMRDPEEVTYMPAELLTWALLMMICAEPNSKVLYHKLLSEVNIEDYMPKGSYTHIYELPTPTSQEGERSTAIHIAQKVSQCYDRHSSSGSSDRHTADNSHLRNALKNKYSNTPQEKDRREAAHRALIEQVTQWRNSRRLQPWLDISVIEDHMGNITLDGAGDAIRTTLKLSLIHI